MLQFELAGTVDVSTELYIVNSTDGSPETGVVWNTPSIDLWYRRRGALHTSITEATLADAAAAHADGGFVHVRNGVYRFDLPDLACGSGVKDVVIGGAITGMHVVPTKIILTAINLYDPVRGGMTALPPVAAQAIGGLPTLGPGAGQVNQTIAGRFDAYIAPEGLKKNTAFNNFPLTMINSTDHVSPLAGLTVTPQRSIDGGTFGGTSNSVTAIGSGHYKINLSAADLNGDMIIFRFTATGADETVIVVKTAA